MISPQMRWRLFGLLSKHGIRVIHAEPGRIVASIGTWIEYEQDILQLVAELRADQDIVEAHFSNGVAEVAYNESAFSDRNTIERWMDIFEKYPF